MFAELIIASEAQQDVVEVPHIPGPKKVAHPFDVTASKEFYLFIEKYHTDFGRFSQIGV